jgi:DNA replication regulator SLD3
MELNLFDTPNPALTESQIAESQLQTSPAASIAVIRSIPRASLPLAWLDTSSPLGQRVFSSTNSTLERSFATPSQSPIVLLAQDKLSSKFCAIEQVTKGVYALCWIGTWINQELLTLESATPPAVYKPIERKHDSLREDKWWAKAALPEDAFTAAPEKVTRRLKLSMAKPQIVGKDTPVEIVQPLPAVEDDLTPVVLDNDQLFDNLVSQYLEALYLNRTSLAFFAKGPLSRIRANNNQLSLHGLATFLRTTILSSTSMDKKFKTKLPEFAASFASMDSDDEQKKAKRKSIKKRKLKINSDGIYSFEGEYVQKWWNNDDESISNHDESGNQRIERRVKSLRIRETLLQIILVLEIIALESTTEWKQAEETKPDDLQPQTDDKPKKRPKKPMDLNKHLDHLIDMLLIWHTVGLASDSLALSPEKQSKKGWDKDRLGSFCVEVIIPFYKRRVPKLASHIVQKFGGSSQSPDKRRKPTEKQTDSSKSASKSESQPTKPLNKSLQRTISLSSSTSKHPRPQLSRSSTDSSALSTLVKREGSEAPSLSSFPLLSQERKRPKTALKHLQARQVSMSSLGSASNSSSKRKRDSATQEDELKSAIALIKRPNRTGVGREVANEREKRASFPPKNKPKPSGSARKALLSVENVQVMATPHANRKVDIFARQIPTIALDNSPDTSWKIVSSSNPSTATRGTGLKLPGRASIAETPCKEPSKLIFASPEGMRDGSLQAWAMAPPRFEPALGQQQQQVIEGTPVRAQSTKVFGVQTLDGTPVRSRSTKMLAIEGTPIRAQSNKLVGVPVIEATPVRPTSHMMISQDVICPSTPLTFGRKTAAVGGTPSIYDDLGWDRYDVED